MKQVLFLILFIIPIFVFCQKYYLKKGKRKIELIQKSPIAIFTNKDSIVAKDNKGDFSIFTLTKDSITIRRPDKTKDTVLEDVDNPNFIHPNWDCIDVKWYRILNCFNNSEFKI